MFGKMSINKGDGDEEPVEPIKMIDTSGYCVSDDRNTSKKVHFASDTLPGEDAQQSSIGQEPRNIVVEK